MPYPTQNNTEKAVANLTKAVASAAITKQQLWRELYSLLWEDYNATPAAIFTELGTLSSQVLEIMDAEQASIDLVLALSTALTQQQTTAASERLDEAVAGLPAYVVNADGTVTVVLGPPVGLEATVGDTQVALTWTASAGATGYKVYQDTVLVSSPVAASYTATDLTNGTEYSFTVAAVNAAGIGTQCVAVTATPTT